jgi:hypothetical protein
MSMLRSGLLLLAAIAAVAGPACADPAAPSPDFAPGQEWSIRSTAPTTAKVIIGRVESWSGDRIAVSISVIDVPTPQGGVTVISHMPFDKAALAGSVDKLLATGVSPDPGFEGGYKQWRDAKGGIFTISVEKAIELAFQAIPPQQRAEAAGTH